MPPPSSAADVVPAAEDERPDFLVRLGILLPCTVEDVEAAYRAKAMLAHPDRGGATETFLQLQTDYERASEYAKFQTSRRGWLAANIERYAEQEQVVAEIGRLGGSVEMQTIDWVARDLGPDFAQVLDRVVAIRLTGPAIDHSSVQMLARHSSCLGALKRLDLSQSRIGNGSLEALKSLSGLQELDLQGTFVSDRGVQTLASMSGLRRVGLAHSFVTWWGALRLRSKRPDLTVQMRCPKQHPARAARRSYRWMFNLLLLYFAAMVTATHIPLSGVNLPSPKFGLVPLDKLAHVGLYAGLAFLASWVLALRNPDQTSHRLGVPGIKLLLLWLLLGAWAIFDEVTQPLTNRTYDTYDLLADAVGATLGIALFAAIQFIRLRPFQQSPRAIPLPR